MKFKKGDVVICNSSEYPQHIHWIGGKMFKFVKVSSNGITEFALLEDIYYPNEERTYYMNHIFYWDEKNFDLFVGGMCFECISACREQDKEECGFFEKRELNEL